QINALRAGVGMAPVGLDRELSHGCEAHARYLARNADRLSKSPDDLDDEDAALPGFSPEGRTAARPGGPAQGEPLEAPRPVRASGFRRLRVLDPQLPRVGIGTARDQGGTWVSVFDFDAAAATDPPTRGRIVVYPVEGQQNVPLAFAGNEVPDPIPEAKRKVGG